MLTVEKNVEQGRKASKRMEADRLLAVVVTARAYGGII
jgi:hypothetical protein